MIIMAVAKGWNKADVMNHMVEVGGLSKQGAAVAIDATIAAIKAGVSETGGVQLIGFGNFEKRKRSARNGRNPQTGEQITIAESVVAGFKAAKGFNSELV
jgi:DNA-binding protein HU-beta